MPGAFEDRENTFEKQFANDEALRFRAVARRNKAVARWAAEMKGLSPEAAEKVYGVVVKAIAGSWTIDQAATAARRAQMKTASERTNG